MAKKALALEGDWTNRSAFDFNDEVEGSVFDRFVVIVDDIDEVDDLDVADDEDDEDDVDVGEPTKRFDVVEASPFTTKRFDVVEASPFTTSRPSLRSPQLSTFLSP